MKRLGVTLLAAALSLPAAFASAQQEPAGAPATGKKVEQKVSKHKHSPKKKKVKPADSPAVGK